MHGDLITNSSLRGQFVDRQEVAIAPTVHSDPVVTAKADRSVIKRSDSETPGSFDHSLQVTIS